MPSTLSSGQSPSDGSERPETGNGSQTQGLQVCKWYLLWGLKSVNRTYFGLFGATGKEDIDNSASDQVEDLGRKVKNKGLGCTVQDLDQKNVLN